MHLPLLLPFAYSNSVCTQFSHINRACCECCCLAWYCIALVLSVADVIAMEYRLKLGQWEIERYIIIHIEKERKKGCVPFHFICVFGVYVCVSACVCSSVFHSAFSSHSLIWCSAVGAFFHFSFKCSRIFDDRTVHFIQLLLMLPLVCEAKTNRASCVHCSPCILKRYTPSNR